MYVAESALSVACCVHRSTSIPGSEIKRDVQGKPTSSRFGPCRISVSCWNELGRSHQHPPLHENQFQKSERDCPYAPAAASSGQDPHERDARFGHDAPSPSSLL